MGERNSSYRTDFSAYKGKKELKKEKRKVVMTVKCLQWMDDITSLNGNPDSSA